MVRPPFFLRWIYPNAIWNLPSEQKVVYLTFDDGPTPVITEKIVELLEEYDAKATFFCIGKNIEQHPELFKLVKSKGHHIGSHTYSHINGWKSKSTEYLNDYQKGRELVGSNLFRPPYGRILLNPLQTIQKQDKLIMWDILSKDYDASLTPETVLNNVLKNIEPGAIIVFHDSEKAKKNVLAVLPQLLQNLKQQGYTMEAIPY
jgi:peptidoglycan/xylan/chitin deacetylase (PgdA/CDA1 family)